MLRRPDLEAHFGGRVAIVTGGASGIGRALCLALADRGAPVVAADVDLAGAERTARAGGRLVRAVELDVTHDGAVGRLVDATVDEHGRLDLMFNNAGVGTVADARDYSLEDWNRILAVNLSGVVHGTRHALRVMAPQGCGHIVNTASAAGLLPLPTNVPYSATKFAVVGLSRSLRAEGAALGVKVTALCPGLIQTAILDSPVLGVGAADFKRMQRGTPMDADRAAQVILRGVAANRALVVFPASVRALLALERTCPPLLRALERRLIAEFRRHRHASTAPDSQPTAAGR